MFASIQTFVGPGWNKTIENLTVASMKFEFLLNVPRNIVSQLKTITTCRMDNLFYMALVLKIWAIYFFSLFLFVKHTHSFKTKDYILAYFNR